MRIATKPAMELAREHWTDTQPGFLRDVEMFERVFGPMKEISINDKQDPALRAKLVMMKKINDKDRIAGILDALRGGENG